jgi:hypothetical protein
MSTAHLVESVGEMGVCLDVTDNGKLRIESNQDFVSTPEFDQLKQYKSEIVSYLNQQEAERLVSSLELHDDRVFIHQCLIGIYGTNRLDTVNKYLEQWQQGSSAEPINIKKDNAGRNRANTWLRKSFERN